ncbi:phosphatidylinositol 5-phosphate 4-kinase type-2 gamma isoform X1 [Hyaena hyaena]|uniref:phosphatidylinositol 5-phosphate 4-kinase type-2 gamma isoform X1 n=1 Tax=Hyaena hyaena TaxID=95912 RepID=UPI001923594D|nr:phosphatidylinositol 5-phosphate 4-kinase type-2 gamma isoform X1 [Hyaena hyaena]
MASSSVPPATVPAATAAPGPGFGFASKTKKKHFVQQKVKVFRAADPLVGVFLWGVAHSINELSQVPPPVMLLPDDFKASSKIKVNNHLFHRENLPSHFKFKEYCPQVFRNLRDRFGIDDQDYLAHSFDHYPMTCISIQRGKQLPAYLCPQVSLTRSPPSESEGSDGRFLISYDRTLVIKEVSSEDIADMHSNLSNYHQYIVKCHGNTLLPQFLGMYRVSVDNEDSYMLVMRNMFSHRLPVHRKYDLKGSLVSREASDKEKVKELPTLKDMDFLNKNQKVYIGEEEKKVFLEKLKRDVEFLVQLKIMDYSLLLGIHDIIRGSDPEEEGPVREEESEGDGDCGLTGPPALVGSYGTSPEGIGGYIHSHRPLGPGEFESFIDVYAIRSAEGAPQKEVYFMGLIDILTQYDAKKKAAHAAKTVKHGAGAEISTVHPEQYAKRFLDFITNIFA